MQPPRDDCSGRAPRGRRAVLAALVASCLASAHWPASARAGNLVDLASRPAAPDFVLQDIDGRVHRLSQMRGAVVLINFWASWCAPCRAEMPSLERLRQRVDEKDVRILAVNLGERREAVTRFAASLDPAPTFDILLDRELHASRSWPTRVLPITYIVDKGGRVTHVSRGARYWDGAEVVELIHALSRAPEDADS